MSRKLERIRWTIEMAASEFGVDRKTVTKGLKALDIEAGEDGKYSTADIDRAIHGDLDGERLQLVRAQRIGQEIENARREGELIPTGAVARVLELAHVAIRQKICSSSMPQNEAHELLEDLAKLEERDLTKEVRDAERRKR